MAVTALMDGQVECMVCFCRTCESLSAEALVVASRAVVQTDAFKKQSRTSERWLMILEVGLPDLATYLQEQRAAGYTIIGKELLLGLLVVPPPQGYGMCWHCLLKQLPTSKCL
jgi:hypothetical protein